MDDESSVASTESPCLVTLAETTLIALLAQYPLGYAPRLEWRNYRTTAGRAHFEQRLITLSQVVLKSPEQVVSTLKHEYAHLLAFARFGRKGTGHGPAWRQAMLDLGEQPKVTHSYAVIRNTSRQVVLVQCTKCGETFTRKRALPKRRKYMHVRCGGLIRTLGAERVGSQHD